MEKKRQLNKTIMIQKRKEIRQKRAEKERDYQSVRTTSVE
jgi:hypothetical protein